MQRIHVQDYLMAKAVIFSQVARQPWFSFWFKELFCKSSMNNVWSTALFAHVGLWKLLSWLKRCKYNCLIFLWFFLPISPPGTKGLWTCCSDKCEQKDPSKSVKRYSGIWKKSYLESRGPFTFKCQQKSWIQNTSLFENFWPTLLSNLNLTNRGQTRSRVSILECIHTNQIFNK